MIYYFIAYFGKEKAFCYDSKKNQWNPYHKKLYREIMIDYEKALQVLEIARKKHPDKAQEIFLDIDTLNREV